MRLLLYSSQFPTPRDPNGGIFTAQLATALAGLADVSVMCPIPWCPDVPWVRDSQACRWYAGVPRTGRHGNIPVHYPRYFQPPLIAGSWQPWWQALGVWPALRQLHRRLRFDAVNVHWVYPDGVAAAWMAQRLGIPVMLTALGSDVNVYADYPARRKQMRGAFRRADRVTAVSTALVERIRGMGVDAGKVSCIGNGVDTNLFRRADDARVRERRNRLGLQPERKYLLFVGRLHPVKGLSCLLEALALLHSRGRLDFDTILVGDGELRRECEDFVSARGIKDNVRFAGEVPHSRVHEWLQACDMLCLPSLMEGMPNVVLEAQACGLPVVASRVGALPDMIGPRSGILVEPRDPVQLAAALERACHVAWDRGEIARAAGLQGWETVAARYFEAIRAIANPAGRLRPQE